MELMSVVVARNGARAVATDKRVQGWHWGLAKGSLHVFPKFILRAYRSRVNIPQPKSAGHILRALTLCSSCAIDAYGWSSASFLHPSIRQQEKTMSFVAWVVLGLAAGFIGSQLVDRKGKSILPDILLGVVGATAGGWLFYSFGPAGVNGLNLYSHFAAVIGSLVFLLIYYALKPIEPR
jgi:uncharacterized membrane protein YeaQ/YmgE (transglycosylase-associated protein family)